MIETVQQLKWLIKDSFKGKACGVVGALTAGTAEATSVATGDSVWKYNILCIVIELSHCHSPTSSPTGDQDVDDSVCCILFKICAFTVMCHRPSLWQRPSTSQWNLLLCSYLSSINKTILDTSETILNVWNPGVLRFAIVIYYFPNHQTIKTCINKKQDTIDKITHSTFRKTVNIVSGYWMWSIEMTWKYGII